MNLRVFKYILAFLLVAPFFGTLYAIMVHSLVISTKDTCPNILSLKFGNDEPIDITFNNTEEKTPSLRQYMEKCGDMLPWTML
jgi:hypothetical protein